MNGPNETRSTGRLEVDTFLYLKDVVPILSVTLSSGLGDGVSGVTDSFSTVFVLSFPPTNTS